jgi:hypothetical protein
MHLFSFNGSQMTFSKELASRHPPYAVLSHTCRNKEEEVIFSDVIAGTGPEKS